MSKATENIMATEVPPAAVPQGGYFIPGAPIDAGAGAYQQQEVEKKLIF